MGFRRRAFEWAVPWRGEGLRFRSKKRKDIDSELTQSQLNELLETESARTLIEAGEERGWVEPAELEALASAARSPPPWSQQQFPVR